jgi:antitoxin PrlF
MVITSKLTSKAQTTVPQPVRAALNLEPGDALEYRIEVGRVILTKHADASVDDPFRTFDEWHSQADAEAYADL